LDLELANTTPCVALNRGTRLSGRTALWVAKPLEAIVVGNSIWFRTCLRIETGKKPRANFCAKSSWQRDGPQAFIDLLFIHLIIGPPVNSNLIFQDFIVDVFLSGKRSNSGQPHA